MQLSRCLQGYKAHFLLRQVNGSSANSMTRGRLAVKCEKMCRNTGKEQAGQRKGARTAGAPMLLLQQMRWPVVDRVHT